jgi:protein arginine kinase activator
VNCHFCDKEATVHLTEIVNGQMVELHLCEEHAREKGADFIQSFSAADFLATFSNIFSSPALQGEISKLACPACQMSWQDFSKLGRLGCAECYDAFQKPLEPLLRRIQRSGVHQGKRPVPGRAKARPAAEIRRLQAKLKRAVEAEDFEAAAKLRDEIRTLENASKPAS